MPIKKEKDLKAYYNIKEVAELIGVSETLLRYWEKEFPNIKPQKGNRGVRQYTKDDIAQVKLVHHLVKERGLTLQGARDAIKRDKGNEGTTAKKIDVINRLKSIRDELQEINRNLNGIV